LKSRLIAGMAKRMTVRELASMPHYHPTLAEIWTYPAEELAEPLGRERRRAHDDAKLGASRQQLLEVMPATGACTIGTSILKSSMTRRSGHMCAQFSVICCRIY
jgi:hypothetical protein